MLPETYATDLSVREKEFWGIPATRFIVCIEVVVCFLQSKN
jgi:hypothetical protein